MRTPRLRFTMRGMMAAVALVALYLALTVPVLRFVDFRSRLLVKVIAPEQRVLLDLAVVVLMTLLFSWSTYLMLVIVRRARHLRRLLRGETETGREPTGPASLV